MYEMELERKALVNNQLLMEYDKLNKAYSKERTWLKRNGKWLWFGAGIVVGGTVTYYVIK